MLPWQQGSYLFVQICSLSDENVGTRDMYPLRVDTAEKECMSSVVGWRLVSNGLFLAPRKNGTRLPCFLDVSLYE